MRYKCIGNPHCLKSFEYGHALRAHISACNSAQKILRARAEVDKLEHDINLEYPGINGLHLNTYYPTAHNVDQTLRFTYKDHNKFNSHVDESKATNLPRRIIKGVDSPNNVFNSAKVKNLLSHQQN